jgi:hypothetical protein
MFVRTGQDYGRWNLTDCVGQFLESHGQILQPGSVLEYDLITSTGSAQIDPRVPDKNEIES